ncbi:MAG TPA: DNA-3-methyladenine glycosylase 2 family protein [Candidatus Poseidoniaceae archaeon]|nr:MAG TPA: DNA-3-methyladenine glycosylase 2 family protein [Candidatus Poseidoniales archaeon]HIH52918.1 DNA-3-methyladenine glycosylase 2 family protein [Candidatus Poseidoniaceae archaeon]
MDPLPVGDAPWWEEAVAVLAEDDLLGPIVRAYPSPALAGQGDAFRSVANAIVGQQISVAAAEAIWGRLETLLGEVTPARVLSVSEDDLRSCGLTRSKASYVHGLATEADTLLPSDWASCSDVELRKHLMRFRGIGPWTAEMFLMFVLLRPDVFSPGDIGLVRAIQRLTDGVEDGKDAEAFAERWAPWRTAASWFLWRTIDAEPVEY